MYPIKSYLIFALLLVAALDVRAQSDSDLLDLGMENLVLDKREDAKINFSEAYKSDTLSTKILAVRGLLKAAILSSEMAEGDSLLVVGDSLIEGIDFDQSVFIYLLAKAEYLRKASKYDEAGDIYYYALARGENLPKIRKEYADGLQHLGLLHEHLSHYDSTAIYIEKAREIYLEVGDTSSYRFALLCNNLGTAYLRLSDLPLAKQNFQTALEIFENREDPTLSDIAMTSGNLGVIFSREGDFNRAIELVNKAAKTFRNIGDLDGVATNYYNLGIYYYYLGDYGRAKDILEQCLAIRVELYGEFHSSLIGPTEVIAIALDESGNNKESKKYFQKARALIKHNYSEPGVREGYNLENIALSYLAYGQQDSALIFILEANKVLEPLLPPTAYHRAVHYLSLGNIFIANKKYVEGKYWLQKSLALLNELELQEDESRAIVHVTLGQLEGYKQSWTAADEHFKVALTIMGVTDIEKPSTNTISPDVLRVIDYYMHYLYSKYQNSEDETYLNQFEKYAELYQMISEKLRRQFNDPYTKSTIVKHSIPIIETQIGVYASLYKQTKRKKYLSKLFHQAEYSRATMIRDLQDEKVANYARMDKELIDTEDSLRHLLAEVNADYFQYPDSSEVKTKLFEAKESLNAFISTASSDNPKYFALKYGGNMPTISAIQDELRADEIFVEYMIDDTSYYALVISAEAANFHHLGKRDSIDVLIVNYHNQISRSKTIAKELQDQLYDLLWNPIAQQYDQVRVIICPVSSLHYLNMESLKDPQSGKYLIEQHNISYTLSANIYISKDISSDKTESLAIAIAPGFEDDIKEQYKSRVDSTAQLDEEYMQTIRQPWSVMLATKLKSEYKNKALIGAEAPESKVKSILSQGNVIYFGTHAISNEIDPLRSKLVLSKETDSEKEDGYLHAYEIYGLDLAADLTILSACESGIGQIEDGEGMISLAHSIHYAGCPSTILSIWKVDERSNTELVDRFLEYLAEGKKKSDALRSAKLDFMAANKDIHPYFWSGLILMGQDGTVTFAKQNNGLWYFVGAVTLFLLLYFLYHRRNRK